MSKYFLAIILLAVCLLALHVEFLLPLSPAPLMVIMALSETNSTIQYDNYFFKKDAELEMLLSAVHFTFYLQDL